jgi:cobalt-zinc-cadmium efflux system protein
MAHSHNHEDRASPADSIRIAFFLNVVFTIIEIVGGILTNSVAILSDALHDLGDSLAIGFSWYASKLGNKKSTPRFSYGYKRLSLLAAFLNSAVLIGGSIFVISRAVPRLIQPEHVNVPGMFVIAIFGVLINGWAVLKTRKGKTINEKVISLHLLEDVLGWVAVLVVSIIMMIKDVHILDPILSLVITLYVLWNAFGKLKESLVIFLQGVPSSYDLAELEKKIISLGQIETVHDTHIWSLDGQHHILSTHIVVAPELSLTEVFQIKCRTKKFLNELEIDHVTIEMEQLTEVCEREE